MSFIKTGKKRGRKPATYRASDDTYIEGLSRRADGRWRIIATGQTFVEPDERLAIHKFHNLTAKRKQSTIAIPFAAATNPGDMADVVAALPKPPPPASAEEAFHRYIDSSPTGGTTPPRMEVFDGVTIEFHREPTPESAFWPWLRRLILDKHVLIAERTGIEKMAWISEWERPKRSPTLKEIGDLYDTKAAVTAKERTQAKLFWKEFCAAVQVATVRELTSEIVSSYHDTVIGAGNSPTYVRHRFGKIKTMLNFACKRGLATADIRKGLDACAVLVPPKQRAVDPHPIDREDFHKLIAATDEQGKAMLLLALNCCMYASEIVGVHWDQIDFEKGTLVADRGKTGVSRVAVLWGRTVDALNKLPRRLPRVFVSYQGGQANANIVRKFFEDLRPVAKVDKSVKFADVRDGSYTAAAEAKGVQFEHARILAGHRTGMSDHYLKRNPKIVAEACAAVERAYFQN